MIVARHEVPGLEFGHFKKARRPDSLREAWRRADCIIGVPPVFLSRRPPRRCQAQDEEGFSWFAASLGLPARSHRENQDPTSAALEIEAGARGNTGGTPMLLWTDCRAYLLAEGAALPPLTWCVIPPLPSSKCPNSRARSAASGDCPGAISFGLLITAWTSFGRFLNCPQNKLRSNTTFVIP